MKTVKTTMRALSKAPATGRQLQLGRLPDAVTELARKRGIHIYSIGDPAVLVYHHKGKAYRKMVEVTGVHAPSSKGVPHDPDLVHYEVITEHGGELKVCALSLRPGSAIDRIALALELSDAEDAAAEEISSSPTG